MSGEIERHSVESAIQHMKPPIQAAILRLAEAYNYARDTHCDLWDFAVEIDVLTAIGLSVDDLRWLVASGYARHRLEVTRRNDAARSFLPAQDLNFTKKTCFVLTDAGLGMTVTAPVASELRRAA